MSMRRISIRESHQGVSNSRVRKRTSACDQVGYLTLAPLMPLNPLLMLGNPSVVPGFSGCWRKSWWRGPGDLVSFDPPTYGVLIGGVGTWLGLQAPNRSVITCQRKIYDCLGATAPSRLRLGEYLPSSCYVLTSHHQTRHS